MRDGESTRRQASLIPHPSSLIPYPSSFISHPSSIHLTMYETFDHTANVGLRARATDLKTLFAEAARAMFSVMAADLDAVRPLEEVAVEFGAGRSRRAASQLAQRIAVYLPRPQVVAVGVYGSH